MRLFRNKKMWAAVAVAGLMMAGAGTAWAYFTSSGTGTGSATVGSSTSFTVTAGTLSGDALLPASLSDTNRVVDTLPFTVVNDLEGVQSFKTITISVAEADGTAYSYTDGAGDPACTAADFSLNGNTAGSADVQTGAGAGVDNLLPTAMSSNSDGVVTLLPNSDGSTPASAPAVSGDTYYGQVTIQLVENGANQDSCEGQSIPLLIKATS
jgi:hypothetical protein